MQPQIAPCAELFARKKQRAVYTVIQEQRVGAPAAEALGLVGKGPTHSHDAGRMAKSPADLSSCAPRLGHPIDVRSMYLHEGRNSASTRQRYRRDAVRI